MRKLKVDNFNLKHSLECMQTFRWQKREDWYYTFSKDKVTKVKQAGNCLIFEGDRDFLIWALRLNDNLEKIYLEISKDRYARAAIKKFRGLRLIRDEPFLCLISYICSANSSTGNTFRMIYNLSKKFGKSLGEGVYTFPSPTQLAKATESELRACKLGFRAKYVLLIGSDAAKPNFA